MSHRVGQRRRPQQHRQTRQKMRQTSMWSYPGCLRMTTAQCRRPPGGSVTAITAWASEPRIASMTRAGRSTSSRASPCCITFAICGPSTGRNYMQRHSNGAPPSHTMRKRARDAKEEPQTATKGHGGNGGSQGKRRKRSL